MSRGSLVWVGGAGQESRMMTKRDIRTDDGPWLAVEALEATIGLSVVKGDFLGAARRR